MDDGNAGQIKGGSEGEGLNEVELLNEVRTHRLMGRSGPPFLASRAEP